jgi:heme-degrading monooxygenase HmoA
MIVAVVQFDLREPMTLEAAAISFAQSAPAYETIPGLIRKHFLVNEDGSTAGGIYLWRDRDAADAWFTDPWKDRIELKFGHRPTVSYFVSPVSVDGRSTDV